jgi:haloalkane dehalogenase
MQSRPPQSIARLGWTGEIPQLGSVNMHSAYSEFTQHQVDVGPYQMVYVDEGDGPPVVLIHGSPLSSFAFRHQINALASQFRIIVPDQLGYGLSSKPTSGVAFKEQADALRLFLDHLALGSFRLVVHNWGGPSGMAAVSDRVAQIKQLVLVNTTFRPDFAPPLYWRQFTSITGELLLVKLNVFSLGLPLLMRAARQSDIRRHYREMLDPIGTRRTMLRLERLEGYASLMNNVQQALTPPDFPVLIIWGDPDPYFDKRELAWLLSKFPDANLVEIKGGGHFAMEDAPEAFTDALQNFFLTD